MSQAKVDKYKEEKKNREKTVKKAKVKKVFTVLITAAIVGVIIGFPLGKLMYKYHHDKKMENATISVQLYDYWFQEYFDLHHGDKIVFSDTNVENLADELELDTEASTEEATESATEAEPATEEPSTVEE